MAKSNTPNVDPALLAAIVAAMQAQTTEDTTEDTTEAKPAKGRKAATARKANVVKVPSHTTTDDDGNRWEVTMAHESRPGHDDSVQYREPRILIRRKAQGADDFRKVGTLDAATLATLAALPDGKVAAMIDYAAENRR